MKEYTVLTIVERLLELLYVRGRMSGEELGNIFGVDKKTIQRYIGFLRESGYDIESYTGPGGGYELKKVYMNLALSAERLARLDELVHKSKLDENDEREFQDMLLILKGGRYMNSPKIVIYHTRPNDKK